MVVDWSGPFIAAICVNVVLSALTMPAGIGGGILFVPVLRIIADMSQHAASALSQIFITGASLGSILFQVIWQYRHPKEPLLAQAYYVVIMLPILLSGSTLGVFLHNLLPEIVSVIVLLCLCVLSSIVIFKKGIQTYKKENLLRELRGARSTSPVGGEELPVPDIVANLDRGISLVSMECGINVAPEARLSATASFPELPIESPPQSFMYDETAVIPPSMSEISIASLRQRRRQHTAQPTADLLTPSLLSSEDHTAINHDTEDKQVVAQSRLLIFFTRSATHFISFVLAYWCISVLFVILRGSRSHPSFSGITPCGAGFWILSGSQIFLGIFLALFVAHKEYMLIVHTFLTGIVSTISGASGGILLNPMLLHRGLDPQQTSATSTVIMMVMASCSALQFLLDGELQPIFATLMLATFCGAVLGMTLVTWIVKKLGRQSILVFMLGFLVVVGGAMLIFVGIRDVIRQIDAGQNPFALGSIC